MTLSTTDDFPESSLAGDYSRSAKGSSSGRPIMGRQDNYYRNNNNRSRDGLGTPGQQFNLRTERPAHLAATLTRQPVNINNDKPPSALHYIGKANTGSRWKPRIENTNEIGGKAYGSRGTSSNTTAKTVECSVDATSTTSGNTK